MSGRKRLRRRVKRLGNTAQRSLGLSSNSAPAITARVKAGEEHFVPDDPRALWVGDRPLEEYLRAHDLAWVVRLRTLLEELDWGPLLAAYQGEGRKALHPRTMLGLIVYGMLNRQWSLRELEGLARRDVAAWWLCGGNQPDHSTIGKFIQLHSEVLSEEYFLCLVSQLSKKLKLQAGTAAGDGTVIEAAASHFKALRAEAAVQAAQELAAQAAQAPADQELQQQAAAAGAVAEMAQERVAERKAHGRDPAAVLIVPGEPQAVVQQGKDGRNRPSYKPSTLVHQAGLIVAQWVEPSSEVAALTPLLAQHGRAFGALPQRLLMDAGYLCLPVLKLAVECDLDLLCPAGKGLHPKRAPAHGRFPKEAFVYQPEEDAYLCPAGQRLMCFQQAAGRRGRAYKRYRTGQCASCSLRGQCTTASGRTIKRYGGDELKELMAAVLGQSAARKEYSKRKAIVEPPFAELRERQGLKRFHRRHLRGVRVEFSLHCMAFNLKRAVGAPAFTLVLLYFGRGPRSLGQLVGLAVVTAY